MVGLVLRQFIENCDTFRYYCDRSLAECVFFDEIPLFFEKHGYPKGLRGCSAKANICQFKSDSVLQTLCVDNKFQDYIIN